MLGTKLQTMYSNPGWNRDLNMLEQWSQRYIEKICSPHFRDFGNGFFEQISTFFCTNRIRIFQIPSRNPQFFPKSGKSRHFRETGKKRNVSL